ncbi:hypothetical protein KDA_49240 [Dictyobacter alpinus]|uniref:Uncharacterized protein n=1 Tax=Dictyobacter alpinus TaxID=2014873 RepID=A0A402BDR5_9CHLR|nr:hypothetical protein KDA_49240 [Dictyobacter alpinus]
MSSPIDQLTIGINDSRNGAYCLPGMELVRRENEQAEDKYDQSNDHKNELGTCKNHRDLFLSEY